MLCTRLRQWWKHSVIVYFESAREDKVGALIISHVDVEASLARDLNMD